jgi:hypothetical protein
VKLVDRLGHARRQIVSKREAVIGRADLDADDVEVSVSGGVLFAQ